jgi:hypothetical protein
LSADLIFPFRKKFILIWTQTLLIQAEIYAFGAIMEEIKIKTETTIDFSEVKNYHAELFRQMFGTSDGIEQLFGIVWKNHLQAEIITELIKQKSKYFSK